MEAKSVKIVDSNLRKSILNLAQKYFKDKNSPVALTIINTEMLGANNIDYKNYKEYVAGSKITLRKFLELFPEVFLLEDRYMNGGIQVYCTLNAPSKAKIEIVLGKMIVANGGKYLLATIPGTLAREYDIDYRKFADNKQLKQWLEKDFNNRFIAKGDHLYLTSEIPQTEKATAPTSPNAGSNVNGEIAQLHSIAYMSWQSSNAKVLQKYSKQTKTPDQWSALIAHSFSDALIGNNDFYCYTLNGISKIVFDSGVKTENGNRVYCILQNNPLNVSGNLQRFAILTFCCILEEDNEICAELKTNLPELFRSEKYTEEKYESLHTGLQMLTQYQSQISALLPEFENAIQSGRMLNPELYSLIKAYYDKWNYIHETIEYLGWETDGIPTDTAYLAKRLESTNMRNDVFNEAVELFVLFAEKMSSYCSDSGLKSLEKIIQQDIQIAKDSSAGSYAEFKELIPYYIHLINITNCSELTDSAAESLEKINPHFNDIVTPKVANHAFYNKTEEYLGIDNKNVPNQVLQLLESLERINAIEESSEKNAPVDADELLETVLSNPDADKVSEILASVKYFYSTKFEKALISGDYAKCASILDSETIDEKYGKNAEELKFAIDQLENDTASELTFCQIGKKLLSVIGNSDHIAEKFLIVGLLFDSAKCSKALVNLYLQENDTANFLKIWEKYQEKLNRTPEIIKQLLFAHASNGESALKAFLQENLGVLYVPEYSSVVCQIAEEYQYSEISHLYSACAGNDDSVSQPNAFELQVLACGNRADENAVKRIIDTHLPSFASWGYTSAEAERISGILSSADWEDENLSSLEALYRLQGNKNRTVETFLWINLLQKYDQNHCVLLLRVLSDAQRYKDVCLLYTHYEEYLSKSQISRKAYLNALIKSVDPRFYEFACGNFQECMSLLAHNTVMNEDITQLEAYYNGCNGEKEATFCAELLTIKAYLDDVVLRSIITLSDDLREIAIDTDKLTAFGLDADGVDEFVSVFKTDGYSRDRSILGVAHRLYSFIGADSGNVTGTIAMLAQTNGFDAASLLWHIYTDITDHAAMLKLLEDYPEFQAGKEREYCGLLLQSEQYETFLQASQKVTEPFPELAAQTVIAKCRSNQDVTDDIKNIITIDTLSPEWVIDMVVALYETNAVQQMIDFIVAHFDESISAFSEEDVFAFVTAKNKLSEETLKALQKQAAAASQKLALYIFETFGIGRMKGASKEFFADFLAQYASNTNDAEKKDLRNQIRIIYAKNDAYLTQITLSDISVILANSEDEKDLEDRIESALENTRLTADGILSFMEMANAHHFAVTPTVCAQMIRMCQSVRLNKECIAFMIPHYDNLFSADHMDVLHHLCQLHIDAFAQGYCEKDWCEAARKLCHRLINTQYFYSAYYCLYNIEKMLGNTCRAKFVLHCLKEKKHQIPDSLFANVAPELQAQQMDTSVTIFDMFIEMANMSSLNEIVDYCDFCGKFIEDKASLAKYYNDVLTSETAETYSIESCIVLLKLLYSEPTNLEYWFHSQKMPLESYPEILVKLLHQTCILENKEPGWKKCIDLCERHGLEDLLTDVLIDCAKTTPSPYGLQNFRQNLADKVNANPAYFSQFPDNKLQELVTTMVRRLDTGISAQVMHTAIKDMSTIVIATDSAEALAVLLEEFEDNIYGENCNLGFAIVCRLIRMKRFAEAQQMLERLANIPTIKYQKLAQELAAMSLSEIELWATKSVNIELMEIILPDGNYPDINKLNALTLKYSSADKAEEGVSLMCTLLDDNPDDYGCYMSLFILCKQLPHRLDMLHKALCGLIKNEPGKNSRHHYTRTRKDLAVLLAKVNAIILAQNKTEEFSAFDGYDFRIPAREFYQKCGYRVDDLTALSEIQTTQDNMQSILANRSNASTKIICDLAICSVTGSWSAFLTDCWKNHVDFISEIKEYSSQCKTYCNGLARSILNIAYSLETTDREAFIAWIKGNLLAQCASLPTIGEQTRIALALYKNEFYTHIPQGVFEENILNFPFEEQSLLGVLFRSSMLQVISKAPGFVYPCAMIVNYLMYSGAAMSDCWQEAMKALETSNDVVAHGIFKALHEFNKSTNISHRTEKDTRKNPEIYESYMRVTGIFSNNEQVKNDVSKANFNTWSCINMVMALLYTARANEVNRLKRYFAPKNRQITDVLLKIIDNDLGDSVKIEAINSLPDGVDRGLACYVAGYLDYDKRNVFLSDMHSANLVRQMLEDIAGRNPKQFTAKKTPRHFMWVEPLRIHKNAYSQLEDFGDLPDAEAMEVYKQEDVAQKTLSFVADLTPITADAETSIDALWDEHQRTNPFGLGNYQKRLDLSRQIYQIALGEDISTQALNDYAIRYGVDRYYYCMGHKQYTEANTMIFEMVAYHDATSKLEGNLMLKDMVSKTALHELLYRGYPTLRGLVDAYVQNKQAFIKMRNMLPSWMSVEQSDVNAIFSALEIIAKCLSEISVTHSSAYQKALDEAKKLLSDTAQQGWGDVRSSVRQIIQDEINRIAQRPVLSVTVISQKAMKSYGCIFGQVENVGNDIAENVTIQLEYADGTSSAVYALSKLEKGESAAFEIDYSVPRDTARLEYSTNLVYENRGEKYTCENPGELIIEEEEYMDYPSGLYITDRPIGDFQLMEDGSIHSDNFFGRKEEKRKIDSIFGGRSFAHYKNVVIKGIRRAGKTSILYYLLKYANTKCDDAIAVYVTCEGIKADNQPIQRALIDRVVRECRALNVGNVSNEDWTSFVEKWTLPENSIDREADDLQYFYRELKALNGGKGLMLIIDEFDILIEEVANNQGIYNTLLPSLRVLLNSVYCQEAVHLVICGSNKLIRYMDGGTFNQLFQQFGDNVIEIGKLLEHDMKEMLQAPYREHNQVAISQQALKWIWKYTNGLVWYSKLIANCALNRARNQERYVVYPSDVVDAVITVISHHDYFKSLVTSCRPNELKVLDAMQSITSKATEYVSLSKLLGLLADEFSQKDIEGIINTLEMMQVVQRNPYDRLSYRFAVELYWHYFRVTPSNYQRAEEIPANFKEGKHQSSLRQGDYDDF